MTHNSVPWSAILHIQSSSSPPPLLPKYTSIKHHHFGRDHGAAAIHRQCQTFLVIRLLSILQLTRKTQSSTHLPKFTLIKHRRSGINHGAVAATWQCTTALHNQATDSIPICVEIAREVTKIHPIKREPTPTPPKIKIHLDHTLPFWKQSRCHRTTRLCQHSNLCGNCMRTSDDTSNLVGGPTYTFQNHTTIFLEDQSLTNCHNTISNHNAPSLTTLSSCPNPP